MKKDTNKADTNSIDSAIDNLTKRIDTGLDSADALRFTQAALNLAHLKNVLKEVG